MTTTNLKIILRKIQKQKSTTLLSIIVLTFGMASFMLIFNYIKYQKGFDHFWQNANQIYRVTLNKTLTDGSVLKTASNYPGLGWVFPDEVPEVEFATSLWEDKIMAFTTERNMTDIHFFWGDASFFKVFNCRFINGDPHNPFPSFNSMAISESASMKLFGTANSLGKTFKINEGWEFQVSGVFADFSDESHLKVEMLGTCNELFYFMSHFDYSTSTLRSDPNTRSSLPNPSSAWLWTNPDAYTYIKLKEGVTSAGLSARFDNIYRKYTSHLISSGIKSQFNLQPVSSIHTGPTLSHEISPTIDSRTIAALWIIAVMALVMSWIIFINFQISQSIDRAKELGMKKVIGAHPLGLASQIIFQSLLTNIISIVLALSLYFLSRKYLSNYLELKHLIPVDISGMFVLIIIFLGGSALSSLYPALIMLPKDAQKLLSNSFIQKNDGFRLRHFLIVFQFAATIGLIIATAAIVKQVSFMKNKNLGLSVNQTVYSYIPLSDLKKPGSAEKLKTFMEEVKHLPGISNSTLSSSIPGNAISFHSNQIFATDSPDKAGINFAVLTVENHFDEVFQPKLLAGRFFNEEDKCGGNLLILNKDACNKLGFVSPELAIGKFVNVSVHDYINVDKVMYQITGVVEDFHHESPRKAIEPLLIINDLRWKYDIGYLSVSFNANTENKAFSTLKKYWESFYPSDPFDFKFINDAYQYQLKSDSKLAGLFSVYTGLSILLAILGLLGIASNAANKRVKEIGIRKVNGARITEILVLLNKDFALSISVAFIIIAPISAFTMHHWLESFAYRTSLSWWIFAFAGLLALIIALITVSFQSWRTATRNPVEALRYE